MPVCLSSLLSFCSYFFRSLFFLSFVRFFFLSFYLFLSFYSFFFHSFFISCFLFSLSSCKKCSTIDRHIFLSQSVCLFLSFHSFILSFVFSFPFTSFIYSFILSFVLSFIFFFYDFFSLAFSFFSLRFCWKLSTFDIGNLNCEAGNHLTVCVCVGGGGGGLSARIKLY